MRHIGERPRLQSGDRRNPVPPEQQRGMKPDQPINELCTQQRRCQPATAFDQQSGQAALTQNTKSCREIDRARLIRLGGDHVGTRIAQ